MPRRLRYRFDILGANATTDTPDFVEDCVAVLAVAALLTVAAVAAADVAAAAVAASTCYAWPLKTRSAAGVVFLFSGPDWRADACDPSVGTEAGESENL